MDQEIHETRAKHICQGMHEEKWQELPNNFLLQDLIDGTIKHSDDKGPEEALIGMERKNDLSVVSITRLV